MLLWGLDWKLQHRLIWITKWQKVNVSDKTLCVFGITGVTNTRTHLTLRYTLSNSPCSVPLISHRCISIGHCAGTKQMTDVACQRGNSRVLMRCVTNIEFCCDKGEWMAWRCRSERVPGFSFYFWTSYCTRLQCWEKGNWNQNLWRNNMLFFVPVISKPVTAVLTCNNRAISHCWWQ